MARKCLRGPSTKRRVDWSAICRLRLSSLVSSLTTVLVMVPFRAQNKTKMRIEPSTRNKNRLSAMTSEIRVNTKRTHPFTTVSLLPGSQRRFILTVYHVLRQIANQIPIKFDKSKKQGNRCCRFPCLVLTVKTKGPTLCCSHRGTVQRAEFGCCASAFSFSPCAQSAQRPR